MLYVGHDPGTRTVESTIIIVYSSYSTAATLTVSPRWSCSQTDVWANGIPV